MIVIVYSVFLALEKCHGHEKVAPAAGVVSIPPEDGVRYLENFVAYGPLKGIDTK